MSTTVVPEPAAILFLRLELRIAGFSRSARVMDRMMASCRAMALSSSFAPLRALASMPGIMLRTLSRSPMLLSWFIWSR